MFDIFVKSMGIKDNSTEKLIIDTAKRVYFVEGKLHSTTQDIADAAGVSRTLLHYYFRSKDQLVEQVFKDAMNETNTRLESVMNSDLPFKKKVEHMIDVFLDQTMRYPYQEVFLITQINSVGPQICFEEKNTKVNTFLKQIETEMDNGNLERMNPIHFMMNLFSLMMYPLITAPLYKQFFNLSDDQFKEVINERKKMICDMMFK
jgi:TetR/AcrR family transcriptional regulator